MAYAPADYQNEAPIATRLRHRSKAGNAQSSQNKATLGIDANNQSDKASQPSTTATEKRVIHTSSSNRTDQHSTGLGTRKSNVSTPKTSLSPGGTSRPLKSVENKKDSTHKKNELCTSSSRSSQPSNQVAKNSKDSEPKRSETHISSSYRKSQKVAKNSKDSPPRRSEIRGSSSLRKISPLKDQDTKSKGSIPEKNEKQCKQRVKNQSKNSQTRENNDPSHRRRSRYQENQETMIRSSITKQSDVRKPFPSDAGKDQNEMTTPSYYIRWKGFDKAIQPSGWNCELCQKDLAYSLIEEGMEQSLPAEDEQEQSLFPQEESEEEFENPLLPETTILPCSHVFHNLCFQLALSGEQLSDPFCPLCVSML